MFKGDILFPCVPVLADEFTTRLITAWATLGRPISNEEGAELRACMRTALMTGYETSPHGAIYVSWEGFPGGAITYKIDLQVQSLQDRYNDWHQTEEGALFGALPDAKLMSIAATLGQASGAPVLDVGAGKGRTALALAAKGHPTDAIEIVPAFCQVIRESAARAALPVRVFESDVLSESLRLEPAHYHLAYASEVLSHFRSAEDARLLFVKLANALAPGGLLAFNAFVGRHGYIPDRLARELGYTLFASPFSSNDFACLVSELPFEKLSDESAFEFEKANTPPTAWPPTTWFESWSQGSNIYDVPPGKAPVDLRWLVYRRK